MDQCLHANSSFAGSDLLVAVSGAKGRPGGKGLPSYVLKMSTEGKDVKSVVFSSPLPDGIDGLAFDRAKKRLLASSGPVPPFKPSLVILSSSDGWQTGTLNWL